MQNKLNCNRGNLSKLGRFVCVFFGISGRKYIHFKAEIRIATSWTSQMEGRRCSSTRSGATSKKPEQTAKTPKFDKNK